jgi:membrane protein
LLKFLPDAPVRWRDALVGGLVAAVLFSTGKKLFALYLAHAGMANSFGAAGSLAVLMMWLYFSAVVLLLGAEFAAARGRMHDPRGMWGFLHTPAPGSRAMLASVIAASTVGAGHPRSAALEAPTGSAADLAQTPIGKAVSLGRTVMRAESQATRVAAATLVHAGRTAVAADRYVRRHPWRSVLLAAGTALAMGAVVGRRDTPGSEVSSPAPNPRGGRE